jgi:L-ribulokinase
MTNRYVIGVDYGTDSVRAIIVDADKGGEIASSVFSFPRWSKGFYCDAAKNQFRQHPLDYIEGLEAVIKGCLQQVKPEVAEYIYGISIATTGSTPVAVNEKGIPLALLDEFSDNPNAMFVLWKDHTSISEAAQINAAAKREGSDYLKYVGGVYSSEWYWAKLLHVLRLDEQVREACYTWVEHSDWMPFLLTGGKDAAEIKRNVCAAGHKALWSDGFNGLPPVHFFESVDPLLAPFAQRFGRSVYAADRPAGQLCAEWAGRLGLSTAVVVGIGAIDAHMGAVGGVIQPYYMSKVIGTSTCDMIVVPKQEMKDVFVEGICGQVDDSILPGMVGLEAGQSAFGDIYSWFRELLLWPVKTLQAEHRETISKLESTLLEELGKQASALPFEPDSEFALDWFNGRRTPDANPNLKGLIGGLTLGSDPPRIYRALVESTCFGARAIVDSIEKQGIKIRGIQAIGGIATKSEFVIQVLADVLNRPVQVSAIEQTVALGAAMFAAVVSNVHPDLAEAGKIMGRGDGRVVMPRPQHVQYFNERFEQYIRYGTIQG